MTATAKSGIHIMAIRAGSGLQQFIHRFVQKHGGVGQDGFGHGDQNEKSLNTSGISPCMACASCAS